MAEVVELGDVVAHRAEAVGDDVVDRAVEMRRHFLLESGHAHPAFEAALTVVRDDLPRDQFQERGLPGAVTADQGDAFAGFDGEVDTVEQARAADAVVDAIQGEQRHGWQFTRWPQSLPARPNRRLAPVGVAGPKVG
jgi:hypothetical protein